VVAVASTEAVAAVPRAAGFLSTRRADLADAVAGFLADPDRSRAAGAAARAHALERYGLARFLDDWDAILDQEARAWTSS
jgi:hypothetical protein